MAESLDSLVNNLPEDAFNNLKRYYTGDKLSLVMRKGVYPHEYMDSLERLKETQLPPREAFYSRLNDEGISDEDYAHARKVCKTFEMKTLQDYHNLYNETDVLLLTNIKLVNDKKQAEKLSAKPNFNHCNIFSEDLVAIHMKKIKLHFNKPVFLGLVF